MAPPGGTNNEGLAHRALEAQFAARFRPAVSRDAFLVTPITKPSKEFDPVGVLEMSGEELEEVQRKLSRSALIQKIPGEPASQAEARKVVSVQSSSRMTSFKVRGTPNTAYLPGGAPLVDHLHQRVEYMPDFNCLSPAIDKLRNPHLPDKDRPCSQREFTLGETPDRHVYAALEYLKDNMKLTKSKFFTCVLAADTESIGIQRDDFTRLLKGKPGTTHVVTVAVDKEPADPLPVLFMVGHVGWQVHVRLPTTETFSPEGKRQLKIIPGKLQEKVFSFFRELGAVTGVKIQEDLQEFFDVIKSLYGEDMWEYVTAPLELDRLARMAGYNLLKYSVATLNWIVFGTILPKGIVSIGDKGWDKSWDNTSVPLRVYLAGDISQAAGSAWVLETSWVLQVFPDAHAVTQLSVLTPQKLITWWHDQVVEMIVDSAVPIRPWQIKASRKEMMTYLVGGHKDGDAVVQLTPDWPSVTAGGARYVHSARAFLIEKLPLLQDLDKETWPILHPEQYHLILFGRHQVKGQAVPRDPVRTLAWAPNPDIGPMVTGLAESIMNSTFQKLTGGGVGTKALLMEYVRLNPRGGKELLERVERSPSAGKAVFGARTKAWCMVPPLREMLDVCGLLPARPDGWVDPYRAQELKEKKVAALTGKALEMAKHHKAKMEESKHKYKELKEAAKAARKRAPEKADHSWPLIGMVTPRGEVLREISQKTLLSIGEKIDQPPSKRQRFETTAHPAAPSSERPKPAETVTSGALEAEPLTIQRTVYFSNVLLQDGHSPDPLVVSSPGLTYQEVQVGLSKSEWRKPADLAEPEGIANIYLVGFSHAIMCNQGLKGTPIDVPAVTITLEDWNDDAIEAAAKQLKQANLEQSIVLFWLHDDMVYEHASSGEPLVRSSYDGRLHCEGVLGVITASRMKRLWDQSWPLLEACKTANTLLLMTPLPRYITVPCCDLEGHCLGYYQDGNFGNICRKVAELRETTLRWVSRIDSERIFVISPHLELTEVARANREDTKYSLTEAYSYDGIHLTCNGYRELLSHVWQLLEYEPWKLRPPMRNMPSPQLGPYRPPPTSRRSRFRMQAYREYAEFDEEPMVLTDHTIKFSDTEVRSMERGPWSNSEVQDHGPVMEPSFWEEMRAQAYANGYNPASHPRGLHPG